MQPEIPFLPVFSSMKRLARYNLGSMALGSLTVSFMESIRFILESIRRKLKVASTAPDSRIGRAVHNTSRFCLRCIEWIIKSVNRNAYIMVNDTHLLGLNYLFIIDSNMVASKDNNGVFFHPKITMVLDFRIRIQQSLYNVSVSWITVFHAILVHVDCDNGQELLQGVCYCDRVNN